MSEGSAPHDPAAPLPSWVRLIVAPSEFLRNEGRTIGLAIPGFVAGLGSVIEQLENRLVLNPGGATVPDWGPLAMGVALAAPFSALATYWIGGLWNVFRLRLVGVTDADARYCRRVALLTSLISAPPMLLPWLAAPLRFATPAQAFEGQPLMLMQIFFGLWATWATYTTMREEYGFEGVLAKFLFLLLPLGLTALALIGIAGLALSHVNLLG